MASGGEPVPDRTITAPGRPRRRGPGKPARGLLGTLEVQAQALSQAGIPHRLAVGRCPADPFRTPVRRLARPEDREQRSVLAWKPSGATNSALRWSFSGRRGRHLREYLTAYLMLAPGLLLIFTFGIFPVGFALYVSLHKWLIVRDEFRGLANYVDIIDNLAYFGVFAFGIGAL